MSEKKGKSFKPNLTIDPDDLLVEEGENLILKETYYSKNKEKCLKQSKEYYKNNKEEAKKRRHKTVICICGTEIQKYYLKKHLKLTIHKKNLEIVSCRCGKKVKFGQILPFDWQHPNDCHKEIFQGL